MPPTNGVPNVTKPQNMTTPVRRAPRISVTYDSSAGGFHTPSRSATRPFDWDAARGLKPAPYDPPPGAQKRKLRQSLGSTGTGQEGSPQVTGARKRARIIVKSTMSWWEWFTSLPESWWFKLEMLWQELPLPAPATTGKVAGFSLHILHALARWSDIRNLRDDDVGWEDMRDESLYGDEDAVDGVWIQWTTIATLFLFCFTIMNALVLFTRTRTYDMQLRDGDTPLVNTPNVSYVASPVSRLVERNSPVPRDSSYLSWSLAAAWRWTKHAWNFLLWHPTHSEELVSDSIKGRARIQQLEVWDPHDGFMTVFTIYSPLHALLWTALNPTNWITISFIMGVAWFHLHYLTKAYNNTIKDRAIIHAEVLYEYDNRFVFPRLNTVKKDACVMTNEAETVHYKPRTSRGTA